MLITQDTKNTVRDLELGDGLESGDGGDDVIGMEEVAEQVSAKGGRTHTAVDRSKLEACCDKSRNVERRSQQVHIIYPEQN